MTLRTKLLLDYYVGGILLFLLKPLTILLGRFVFRDHDLIRCSTVTVIKMLGGGSLVIAYPALLAIKKTPFNRRVRLITSPSIRPFAEVLQIFDEIIVIRDHNLRTLLKDSIVAVWMAFRAEAIVDLEMHSRLTTVFCILTCAVNRITLYTKAPFWRKGLATHLVFCDAANDVYSAYDKVAKLFGSSSPAGSAATATFRLGLDLSVEPGRGRSMRIAVAPCCSDLAKERELSPIGWLHVLRKRLAILGSRPEVHLFGATSDQKRVAELAGLISLGLPGIKCLNHVGKASLAESVRLLAQMDELLCIDSALLHLARLLGIPTVSFWGPTNPESLLRPSSNSRDHVYYLNLPCSPCVHLAQRPPCHGNNICMTASALIPNGMTGTFRRDADDRKSPHPFRAEMPDGSSALPGQR